MQALFLYNSREVAAKEFFAKLGPVLVEARWMIVSDFSQGLEGTTGGSFTAISHLVRASDVVLYAVGPNGEGNVQGGFEIDQILKAATDAKAGGHEVRIIPLLVGGAPATALPKTLDHLLAQMDNSHLGGMNLLEAVFKAVTGQPLPQKLDLHPPRVSTEREVRDACLAMVGSARRQGLTVFVGPYAAADAHHDPTPRFYAAEHLKHSASKEEFAFNHAQSDLISHPWLAATVSRALRPTPTLAWEDLQFVVRSHASSKKPLLLHKEIAELARSWSMVGASSGTTLWNGLLIVGVDQCTRLERALREAAVPFGRLRYVSEGEFVYEEPVEIPGEPRFTEVQRIRVNGTARAMTEAAPFKPKPVLLLKVLGCESIDDEPAIRTDQLLRAVWHRTRLPDPLARHVEKAAFLMLGGGFFDPIVSYVFSTFFLPYFDNWEGAGGGADRSVPRYVALQPSPDQGDAIRNLEQDMDRANPDWLRRLSELLRVDWPLADFVNRLTYRLKEARAGGRS